MKDALNRVFEKGFGGFSPGWAAVFCFLLSFGMMTMIRLDLEGRIYFSRWLVFLIGDTVVIPFFALCASYGLQNYEPTGRWYDSRKFMYVFALIGGGAALWLFRGAVQERDVPWSYLFKPSEFYHTFIVWPVLVALGAKSFTLLVVSSRSEKRAKLALVGVLLAILAFFVLVYLDANWLPSRNDPGI